VDEAKLARAPRLWFDDERHDDLGPLACAAARSDVLGPRRHCAHHVELMDGLARPGHVLGLDAVATRVVCRRPNPAREWQLEPVQPHAVQKGVVRGRRPSRVGFGVRNRGANRSDTCAAAPKFMTPRLPLAKPGSNSLSHS